MGIRWGTSDLSDEALLKELDLECSAGVDTGAWRRQVMFKAVLRILQLLLEIRRGLPVAALALLLGACATAPDGGERRPFYYYHANYPEQFEAARERDQERQFRGFSERDRDRRLQNLYRKMR